MLDLAQAIGLCLVMSLVACSPREHKGDHPKVAQQSEEFGRGPCADDPRIGRVGFPGTHPVLIERVEPSIENVSSGVSGVVIIQIIIDSAGVPCSVAVLRSLRSDADRAAVEAVKQWRFIPARLDGEGWPVAYNVAIEIKR